MEFSNIYRLIYFAVFLILFVVSIVLYFVFKAYGHNKWLNVSASIIFLLVICVYTKYVIDTFIYYE